MVYHYHESPTKEEWNVTELFNVVANDLKAQFDALETVGAAWWPALKWGGGLALSFLGSYLWNKLREVGWAWLLLPLLGLVWAGLKHGGRSLKGVRLSLDARRIIHHLDSCPAVNGHIVTGASSRVRVIAPEDKAALAVQLWKDGGWKDYTDSLSIREKRAIRKRALWHIRRCEKNLQVLLARQAADARTDILGTLGTG